MGMKAEEYLRLEVQAGMTDCGCVTERGCQWENVVSSGMRASPMRNGSGGFHPCRVNLTLSCRMGDAPLGDVGRTLGAS